MSWLLVQPLQTAVFSAEDHWRVFALVQMEFILHCAFKISFKTKAHKCCPKVRKNSMNPSPIINLFPSFGSSVNRPLCSLSCVFYSFAGIEKQCHESIQPALFLFFFFLSPQPVLDCNSGRIGVWAVVKWQGGWLCVWGDCALVCKHVAIHIFMRKAGGWKGAFSSSGMVLGFTQTCFYLFIFSFSFYFCVSLSAFNIVCALLCSLIGAFPISFYLIKILFLFAVYVLHFQSVYRL